MVHAAYTAKAAVPDNDWRDENPWWFEPPDDWDHDWPFPGPDPPGYEPEDPRYGCVITGASTCDVGVAYSPTVTLHENKDASTWRTPQPSSGAITWSATLDGEPLLLSVDGSGYAYSVATLFEDVGSYWYGDAPSVTFNLSDDDAGKTIVLTAVCAGVIGPTSFSVSDTHSIEVNEPTYTIECSITVNGITNDLLNPSSVWYIDTKLSVTDPNSQNGWRGFRCELNYKGEDFTYYQGGNPAAFNIEADSGGIRTNPAFEATLDGSYSGYMWEIDSGTLYGLDDPPYMSLTFSVIVKKNGVLFDSASDTYDSSTDDRTYYWWFSKSVGLTTSGDW